MSSPILDLDFYPFFKEIFIYFYLIENKRLPFTKTQYFSSANEKIQSKLRRVLGAYITK